MNSPKNQYREWEAAVESPLTALTHKEREIVMGLGMGEVVLILVIALVVFGPRKLPELGKGLGEGLRGFKDTPAKANSGLTSTRSASA